MKGGIKTMNIGAAIKAVRLEKNLKQNKLAGISNTYLSDIETGRTAPSLKTLKKIMQALGVDISWDIFLKDNYVINV
jgi:transcriptional regulator with XRE-family HTH domain